MSFSFRYRQSERGSSILAALFSTTAGVLFVLLFFDLTRYVAATGALEQAVQKAARCLTPTDGACRRIEAPQRAPELSNWYGYPLTSGDREVEVYAREVDYSAWMNRRALSARYTAFEVHRGKPQLSWTEYSIPVKRYVGLLNSYAHLYADVEVRFRRKDGSESRQCRVRNYAYLPWGLNMPASWSPSQTSSVENAKHFPWTDERWCEGLTAETVGALPEEAFIGSRCFQDGSEWERDYQFPAEPFVWCHLSLPESVVARLFSTSRQSQENPWLRLAGEPVCEGEEGAPSTVPPSTADISSVSVGQRNRPFPVTWTRQFVVVEVAPCNEEEFLAELHKVDTYQELESVFHAESSIDPWGKDFQNGSFLLSGEDSALVSSYNWTYFQWNRERSNSRKLCRWLEWSEAVKKWPELDSNFRKAENWASGGHFENTWDDSKLLSVLPSNCPTAQLQRAEAISCENRVYVGADVELGSCERLDEKLAERKSEYEQHLRSIEALNSQQHFSEFLSLERKFSVDFRPSWSGSYEDQRWEFAWLPVDEKGELVSGPSVRQLPAVQLPREFHQVDFEKKGRPSYPKSVPRDWLDAISKHSGVSADALGWREFAKQPERFVELVEEAIPPHYFDDLYPFPLPTNLPISRSGIELYWGAEGFGEGYDFDLDCEVDSHCVPEDAAQFQSLEEALRHRAATKYGVEEAGDAQFAFHIHEEKNDYLTRLGRFSESEQGNLGLPSCAATRTSCQSGTAALPPEFIQASVEEPAECRNGRYNHCFREPNASSKPPIVEEEIDFAGAEEIALQEIERAFPSVRGSGQCAIEGEAGCARIEVVADLEGVAQVTARYAMPLSFPLNAAIGQDALVVEASTTEYFESAMVGRQN